MRKNLNDYKTENWLKTEVKKNRKPISFDLGFKV